MKKCFTLAEVLITLGVIGVVAALTLPSLLTTISDKIKEHQMEVFERKISNGADLLNIEYGIGPYYNSSNPSYEFVQALSKHLKITTICDKDNLKNCFKYDTIQTDLKNINVTDIKTGKDLSLNENDYTDVAGLVLADGTPMIFSWNKNCPISDPDSANKGQNTSCIQGIVDLNGPKGPNTFGKDIVGFNNGQLGWIRFAGLKISKIFQVYVKTSEYCDYDEESGTWSINETGSKWGATWCCNAESCLNENSKVGDNYVGTLKTCKEMGGRLPSLNELITIAKYVYNNENITTGTTSNLVLDKSKLGPLSGLGTKYRYLWDNRPARSGNHANYLNFENNYTRSGQTNLYHNSLYGICIKDN